MHGAGLPLALSHPARTRTQPPTVGEHTRSVTSTYPHRWRAVAPNPQWSRAGDASYTSRQPVPAAQRSPEYGPEPPAPRSPAPSPGAPTPHVGSGSRSPRAYRAPRRLRRGSQAPGRTEPERPPQSAAQLLPPPPPRRLAPRRCRAPRPLPPPRCCLQPASAQASGCRPWTPTLAHLGAQRIVLLWAEPPAWPPPLSCALPPPPGTQAQSRLRGAWGTARRGRLERPHLSRWPVCAPLRRALCICWSQGESPGLTAGAGVTLGKLVNL